MAYLLGLVHEGNFVYIVPILSQELRGTPHPETPFSEGIMTVRKLGGVLPICLTFALATPLSAQKAKIHQWSLDRPDAHGPISVREDRVLQAGEFQLTLQLLNQRLEGQGVGNDSLTVDQVLSLFDVAPTQLVRQGMAVNVMLGLTEHLSLSATGTFVQKTMDYLAPVDGQANFYLWYQTESLGPEDIQVTALYDVFNRGPYRAHVHAGVSIPIGSIDVGDATPFTDPSEVQLPYQQQLGSGTVDLLPGFTVSVQNEVASLGVQGKATIRMAENNRDWALGDVYQGTMWAAYNLSDYVSVSLAGQYTTWGQVEGADADLDPFQDPAANTLALSGSRVSLPVGFNLLIPDGRFAGHRLGMEFILPIHQDLDGPQLRHDWSIIVGWRKSLTF